eukprot:2920134-Amphidinium_carterae.1
MQHMHPNEAWKALLTEIAHCLGGTPTHAASRAQPPRVLLQPDDASTAHTQHPQSEIKEETDLMRERQWLRQAKVVIDGRPDLARRISSALWNSTNETLQQLGHALVHVEDTCAPARFLHEAAEREWEQRLQSLKQRQRQRHRQSWTAYLNQQHPAKIGKQILRSDYPPLIAGLLHEGEIVMQPTQVHDVMHSTWGRFWDHDVHCNLDEFKRLPFPQHEMSELAPISGTDVKKALSKMKTGRAAGADQLRSEDLLSLPDVLHGAIAAFWMRCEAAQTWPDALRAQQVVFLPKPAHAGKVPQADQLRPIVLLPHMLKA